MNLPTTIEEMEKFLAGLSPEKLAEVRKIAEPMLSRLWIAQVGPQIDAYLCLADETLYGGAAGGGKTDLLLGLATTSHTKSVIFRRQSTDLTSIWDRLNEIVAGHVTKTNSSTKKLRLDDGKFIEFGHLDAPGSERGWMGRDHDLYGFDEAAQLEEFKVNFVIQWNRSKNPKQRCRVVLATNPPIPEYKDGKLVDTGTGAWLMDWFAPWLSEGFQHPAKDGELRWCYMRQDGDRLTTVWVEGPGGYDPITGGKILTFTQKDVEEGRVTVSKSRTFFRALVKDNAFLKDTGYAARLSTSPEPLRSLLLNGSFTVKGEDHPMQIIPTMWVLQANERWKRRESERKKLRQLVLSADIAQGGADTTVVGELLETNFFEEPFSQPGSKTPTGSEVVQMIMVKRRHGSLIVLDGTGGWAGSTRDLLDTHHKIDVEMFIASAGSQMWTKDMLYRFLNLRAEMWWMFREALDPKSGEDICLPPSTRLMTQLTAPIWMLKGNVIQVEAKDEVRKRVGSSTDEADMVLQAWHYRDQAIAQRMRREPDFVNKLLHGERAYDQPGQAIPMDDPLSGW